MATEPFLSLLRELASCYQAFEHMSSNNIRQLGLTPPQFDIIATLGNTNGMSCKELGQRTLITKGTLTGVLDRLEQKLLLTRTPDANDGRAYIIVLTVKGQKLFERIFPTHIDFLRPAFAKFSNRELNNLASSLAQLKQGFINQNEGNE